MTCRSLCYNEPMPAPRETTPEARIDRWLWAARIFKSRSLATRACRNGRVRLNNRIAKASQPVSCGDEIEVRMPPIDRRWRVLAPAVKRVSARLARELAEEITPPAELEKLEKFRRDPANRGLSIHTGLWRTARHPNRTAVCSNLRR